MTRGPREKAIVAAVLCELRRHPGVYATKLHGSAYNAGLPDVHATVCGRSCWFEVKRPGEKPTKLQEVTLQRLREAGAVACVVSSVEDVRDALQEVLAA